MPNVKISDLTAATAVAGANEFEINEAGTSKKVTGTQILNYVHANTVADDVGALEAADIGVTVQGYDADTAKLDTAQEWTQRQNFNATTLTDGATINWATNANQVTTVTLAGNRTMAAPTQLVDGGMYLLGVYQDATPPRTLSWNAVFKFPGGTAPTLSTTANAKDYFTFYSDGTNLYLVGSSLDVK